LFDVGNFLTVMPFGLALTFTMCFVFDLTVLPVKMMSQKVIYIAFRLSGSKVE